MTLQPGAQVRIKQMSPPGHIRTPHYLRGKTGRIERILGPFNNPEQLAYDLTPEQRVLYRVRFDMAELWPGSEAATDTLDAEIYEHWIEPQDAP